MVMLPQHDSRLILSSLIGPINKVLGGGVLPTAVLYCCAGGFEGTLERHPLCPVHSIFNKDRKDRNPPSPCVSLSPTLSPALSLCLSLSCSLSLFPSLPPSLQRKGLVFQTFNTAERNTSDYFLWMACKQRKILCKF